VSLVLGFLGEVLARRVPPNSPSTSRISRSTKEREGDHQ